MGNVQVCLVFTYFCVILVRCVDRCPNGDPILSRGLSPADEQTVTDLHNDLRQLLTKGLVPGQPRAKYMKHMKYDDILAKKCKPVSDQCQMNHVIARDPRWFGVGQNIFMECKSWLSNEQNWTAAVNSWFQEHEDFRYPNRPLRSRPTGHYTQVAWADSDTIGCDFISYINHNKPSTRFCKLYTCNYGPCGNFNNLPPYQAC